MPDLKDVKQIAPQIRSAQFMPDTYNASDNTIEAVAATEAEVLQYSWDGPIREVLGMEDGEANLQRFEGANILDNHDKYSSVRKSVLGIVERAWIKAKKLHVKIRFSAREDLKDFVKDVKDGIQRNLSVGYRIYAATLTEEEGKLPLIRATNWEPFELSFVSVPADFNATTRSQKEVSTNDVIIQKLNSNFRNMPEENVPGATPETQAPAATPAPAPAATPAPAAAPTPAPVTAPAPETPGTEATRNAQDSNRSVEILNACRAANLDMGYATTLISNPALSVDGARKLILDKLAENTSFAETRGANMQVAADETDKLRSTIINGLVLRSGAISEADMKPDEVSAAREFRGRSLLDIAKESLRRSGMTERDVNSLDKMEIAKRAMISNSTSDFPVLLEGTNRRVLLAAYKAIADTWRRFAITGSVSDFREYSRLRMGSFSRLDKVNENAEYKNKPIPDASAEKISAETFGNTINISRKMIVNDDLNAFTRLTTMLARAAARSIEIDVYALLNSNPIMGDGKELFHADHGNLVAGSALSVDNMDALRVAMASQMDPSGNDFIDIRPEILLLPMSLAGTAKIINEAQYDPSVSNKFQLPNKARGLFKDIVDTPRLSGTAYYAFANPQEEPVFEVVFLDGVQTPYLESEVPFDVDGLRWKVRLDYGVGAIGWRGAIKNPGA